MSTINGIIKVHTALLLALLIIGCSNVQATSDVDILFVKCNGQLSRYDNNKESALGKLSFGDVARGILVEGELVYFDGTSLQAAGIKSKKSRTIINLNGKIEKGYNLWQVGHISEKHYYFSVQNYEKNLPINEQKHSSTIYRVNKDIGDVCVVVTDCSSPYFSGYGDVLYYVDENGDIKSLADGKSSKPIVKGDVPSISTMGDKLAFTAFGLVNNNVYVLDLKSGEKTNVIDFFGPDSIYPIIRWSPDGKYIAVKNKSDVSVGTIYVVDIKETKKVFSFENKKACNWFFADNL